MKARPTKASAKTSSYVGINLAGNEMFEWKAAAGERWVRTIKMGSEPLYMGASIVPNLPSAGDGAIVHFTPPRMVRIAPDTSTKLLLISYGDTSEALPELTP